MRRCAFIFLFWATLARGGGGPQNVLVVVNDNSPESLELGQYYQEARGIPERNICHVNVTSNYSIDTVSFSNNLRGPVTNYIAVSGLSSQIDYIVFTRGVPYRVFLGPYTNYEHSSITASMFYDFKKSGDAYFFGCNLASGSRHFYFESERAFTRGGDPSSNKYFLSTYLTATNSDMTKANIDRAVAADATFPHGSILLHHTIDPRNVQWRQFENVSFMYRFLSNNTSIALLDGYTYENPPRTNVMGLMLGLCCGISAPMHDYLPGAMADHLTSYGGVLYGEAEFQQINPVQDRIQDWINQGVAGSYGTIVEPCAFTTKFASAKSHFWYGRGFNLGESYGMAVQSPYQGITVGDPLCAPYVVRPVATISGLASNDVLSGAATFSVTGAMQSAGGTVGRIDAFLDGVFLSTLTNVAPTPGNIVSVTVHGATYSHTVLAGQSLAQVASSLASLVNADTGVSARAFGDRIELKQRALGVGGTGIALAAGSSIGAGSALTVSALASGSNFLETAERAHEVLTLTGTPVAGDFIQVIVTRLDGMIFTNDATAIGGDTALTLLGKLAAAVNSNTSLGVAEGCEAKWVAFNGDFGWNEAYLVARTNTWEGHNLLVTFTVITNVGSTLVGPGFSDNFNDNGSVLGARGQVFLVEGASPLGASYTLATTNLPDGPHELTAVVYDGSAVKAQGRVTIPFVVDNNSLTCRVVNPISGHHAPWGAPVTTDVSIANGTVTQVSLYVEGKLFATTSTPPYQWTLPTTNLGAGLVELQARGDGASGSALSEVVFVTIYSDADGDGASDQWEYAHFGSATNWDGSADPDGDGVGNADEFRADTQPTNGQSFLRATVLEKSTSALVRIEFSSETTRTYRVEVNGQALTNEAAWVETTNFSRGAESVTVWEGGLLGTAEYFRVRAVVP